MSDRAAVHPNAALITGPVSGIRVEAVADPLMQETRHLDKVVDEEEPLAPSSRLA